MKVQLVTNPLSVSQSKLMPRITYTKVFLILNLYNIYSSWTMTEISARPIERHNHQ
jgi:hypothetical protein